MFLRGGRFIFQWVHARAPVGCSLRGLEEVVDSFGGSATFVWVCYVLEGWKVYFSMGARERTRRV
jgi:hypothetical protein